MKKSNDERRIEVAFDAIGLEMLEKASKVECSHEQRRDGLKAILEMVEADIEAIEQNDLYRY